MTTTYGTIPAATTSSEIWFRSSDLGKRRPWQEMASLSLPQSFQDTLSRAKTNISYFHMNYAIIVISVLFLSLLWHPVSLILFAVLASSWFFLYFLREGPVVIWGCEVNESVVLAVLTTATVVFVLTRSTSGILTGVVVGVAVALMHAILRKTGDLVLLNENQGRGDGGEAGPRVYLEETASSTYSSSL